MNLPTLKRCFNFVGIRYLWQKSLHLYVTLWIVDAEMGSLIPRASRYLQKAVLQQNLVPDFPEEGLLQRLWKNKSPLDLKELKAHHCGQYGGITSTREMLRENGFTAKVGSRGRIKLESMTKSFEARRIAAYLERTTSLETMQDFKALSVSSEPFLNDESNTSYNFYMSIGNQQSRCHWLHDETAH